MCITLDEGPEAIDAAYREFLDSGVEILEPPHDAVFGRTFVAADPDGIRLRVAPRD
ncbi:VOC family protein [Nesterenkonia sedimenti]|uniref:VOC family protein n=1 Tax=Nesterenkonia sedimenti TaxID=1463632 RepID=UPI001E32167E|nr:VOC family protein [Nesterenkonia sedimenti]